MAKTPVNFRLPADLLEKLRKRAKADNRTLSNMVETVLQRYVDGMRLDAVSWQTGYADGKAGTRAHEKDAADSLAYESGLIEGDAESRAHKAMST